MSWARNSVGAVGDDIGLPDVTTADNGKIMEVESGEWKLKEGSGGGGGIPAPENPSDGDVLTYSSADDEWVAAAPGGGGGGGGSLGVLITPIPDDPDDNLIMDKTWNEIKSAIEDDCFVYAYFKDEAENFTEWNISYPRSLTSETGSYIVIMNDDEQYEASSADGYPATDYGGGG